MYQGKKWKGIIFDFDGTLLNSYGEGMRRFCAVAVSLGLPVSEHTIARIKKIWGVPGHILVQTCWPEVSMDTFMGAWETFDSIHPISLFPGVQDLTRQLSLHMPLSILTSRGRSTHFQLRCNNLEPLFSFICTLDDSSVPKPHPQSIEPLIRQYGRRGIAAEDLVFIGDSVGSDYELARALGMDFIAVTWGNNTRDDFIAAGLDARYIIDAIEDLSRLIIS